MIPVLSVGTSAPDDTNSEPQKSSCGALLTTFKMGRSTMFTHSSIQTAIANAKMPHGQILPILDSISVVGFDSLASLVKGQPDYLSLLYGPDQLQPHAQWAKRHQCRTEGV